MGKYRCRLSRKYFARERDRLERYRNDVRLRQRGHLINDDFIYEVPSLLNVGQRVSALVVNSKDASKITLGVGSVLIVDENDACYQIQFDKHDFGVQKVH